MEDQERGMETNGRVISPTKRKNSGPDGLTIMIIGSVGKIRSFKLSGRAFLWVLIFLLIYIPASVLVINRFFEIRYSNKIISEELDLQIVKLKESWRAYHKAMQHVALLEDFLTDLETNGRKKDENQEDNSIKEKNEVNETKNTEQDDKGELKSEKIVDTQDIIIQKEGSLITVDFKLVNLQSGENALAGYIHIIAESRNIDPPNVWTYPKEKLENGYPISFRKGELFIIKRFKPIHGRIDLLSTNIPPSLIRVIVYDQSGKLILEKEFEVSNTP